MAWSFIDNIKGKLHKTKGAVKSGAGATAGRPDVQLRGDVERLGGTIQDNWGDLKRDLKRNS